MQLVKQQVSHMTITIKLNVAYRMWKANQNVNNISLALDVHRATVYRWIKRFKHLGLTRTCRYYEQLRKKKLNVKEQVSIKNKIYELREKYSNCCGQKIKYYIKKYFNLEVSLTTVYRYLRKKYKLRNKFKIYKYGEAPKGFYPRQVIQTDTVDFGDFFAFTYVDTFTRETYVTLKTNLESISGKESLIEALEYFGNIELLQNDGGPEFKGEFLDYVLETELIKTHRVSRPYKKNEQSFIESFNRTLRKECLGWKRWSIGELDHAKKRVEEFLRFYNNDRAHISLSMLSPIEFLNSMACRI